MSVALAVALLTMPGARPPGGPAVREVALPFAFPHEEAERTSGALSADGRRLVVWGPAGPLPLQQPFRTRVAVVDLDTAAVTVAREVAGLVRPVAADAHFVYLGLNGADGLLVLAADTLAERTRLAIPPVSALRLGAGRLTVDSPRPPRLVLTVPGLAPVDPPPAMAGWVGDYPRGLVVAGALERGPAQLGYSPDLTAADPPPAGEEPPGAWGVRLRSTGAVAASGRQLGPPAWPLGQPRRASALLGGSGLLPGRPLLATARLIEAYDQRRPNELVTRVVVVYQALVGGQIVAQAVTPDRTFGHVDGRGRPPMFPPDLFVRPGDGVAVLYGDRVYVGTAPAVPPDLPEPLRADGPRAFALVSPGRPAVAPLPAAVGGRPPYTLSLPPQLVPPGVALDPASGGVTVDPTAVAAWLVPALAQSGYPRGFGGLARAGDLDEYARKAADRVEQLTGRRPTGLPVWVTVRAEARDAALERLPVVGGFVFDLPAAAVKAASEAAAERLRQARAAAAGPRPAGEVEALKVRVQALELRLDELNRKLDAVLKALEEKKPKDK